MKPVFSWETVPVYLHLGKTSAPFTDEEANFIANTSNFVCLEKAHGKDHFGSTEKGIAHDVARLKAVNPAIKVLFYWNTFLNYEMYDACGEFAQHPDWVFRDSNGDPIYKVRELEQYNLLNAEFRSWWASIAGRGVREYGCDGIYMDATNQAKRDLWMKRGWGEGNEHLLTDAVIDMMQQARREMGDDAILFYNGLRTLDRNLVTTGQEYLPYADGVKIEHFGAFHSQSKEAIALDMDAMIEAGKAGKMVALKGWPEPGFNWMNKEKMALPVADLIHEAQKKILFSLACFLIAAQEHSYFCYSWGYREPHGSLVDYPEFHKALGNPRGDGVKDRWVYSRSFEHASVQVDLLKKQAQIDWNA